MLKLLKKDLKLNMHPALYLFALLGAMVLIPNYPYIVGVGYSIMHIMVYFQYGFTLILGLISFVISYGAIEFTVQLVPQLTKSLDGYDAGFIWARLTVLSLGVIMYPTLTYAANKIATKKFEKVNL